MRNDRRFKVAIFAASVMLLLLAAVIAVFIPLESNKGKKSVVRLAMASSDLSVLTTHRSDPFADYDFSKDPGVLKAGNFGPPLQGDSAEEMKADFINRMKVNGISIATGKRILNEIASEEVDHFAEIYNRDNREADWPRIAQALAEDYKVREVMVSGPFGTSITSAGQVSYVGTSGDGVRALEWTNTIDPKIVFYMKIDCGGQEIVIVQGVTQICSPGEFHSPTNPYTIDPNINRVDTTKEESHAEEQAGTEQGSNTTNPNLGSGTTNPPAGGEVGDPIQPAQPSNPVVQPPIVNDPPVDGKTPDPGS